MSKKKIIKLNDEQYYKYIMSLKDDAAAYNADGEMFIPDETDDNWIWDLSAQQTPVDFIFRR